MAITVNGNGTITGISAGGLPDDVITVADLANSINTSIAANTAKTGITSAQTSAITANTAKTGITTAQAAAVNNMIANAFISGGIETQYSEGGVMYRSHTFLNNSQILFTGSKAVDFLLVAGGGGGAGAEGYQGAAGGAGAGGMVVGTSQTIAGGNYSIVVGAGGVGSDNVSAPGASGANSTFNSIVATGGGGGPDYNTDGIAGGSGSGGAEPGKTYGANNQNLYSAVSNLNGYGNNGGAGGNYVGGGSGGGGGAGGAGTAANGSTAAGGVGRANSFRTGSNVTYGRGGNGNEGNTTGTDEAAHTGNGAHCTATTNGNNAASGNGGSGIVVIRYAI